MKLTEAQRAELRAKRSAFLTRMVDEFKKVGFIVTFVFCVVIIVWCMVLYTISLVSPESAIIPAVASALQIVASVSFGIIGTAFTVYCSATAKEKKSLNDNDIVKNKDGTFSKLVNAVTSVASNIVSSKSDTNSGENVG